MLDNQMTIDKAIDFMGVGVHSGQNVAVTLKPSAAGRIVFHRQDLGGLEIAPDLRNVEARSSTSLRAGGEKVQTVEHLLASLYALGIDSLDIELDNAEVPIMDGSASPLAEIIASAGLRPLPEKKRWLKIAKPFEVVQNDSSVAFLPGDGFSVGCTIDFPHKAIGRQQLELEITPEVFRKEVAPARTFGFLKDVERLRSQGLALGASFENTIVLDDTRIVNPPLRFPDEFVRHKMLDFLGDLSLLGYRVIGHCRATKAGHALHLRAVRSLLEAPETWVISAP